MNFANYWFSKKEDHFTTTEDVIDIIEESPVEDHSSTQPEVIGSSVIIDLILETSLEDQADI